MKEKLLKLGRFGKETLRILKIVVPEAFLATTMMFLLATLLALLSMISNMWIAITVAVPCSLIYANVYLRYIKR